ncbi:MAG: hypothetical protein M3296_05425 [Actinomycetota bacterium]|nr:hypothetical protein [Actinomycetota bacterium]
MSTEEAPNQAQYEVSIEGEIHQWDKDSISVSEIRELGGFPDGAEVAAVDLATGDEHTLDDDDVHHVPALEPGKPLVKRMDFKRAS